MKRTLIPELYTKEEIDQYFHGIDSALVRYKVQVEWLHEWVEAGRYIVVDSAEMRRQIKKFVKTHKIRKVDYVKDFSLWAFRFEEDYFALRLTLS